MKSLSNRLSIRYTVKILRFYDIWKNLTYSLIFLPCNNFKSNYKIQSSILLQNEIEDCKCLEIRLSIKTVVNIHIVFILIQIK